MTDRGLFLPMSEELMVRMREASQPEERARIVVLFDGTRNRPWGMFLTTETERQYSDRQRPLREARDLSAAEIRDLLADVQVEPAPAVAMRFHVHPDTVDFIVNAVGMGFLKVSA